MAVTITRFIWEAVSEDGLGSPRRGAGSRGYTEYVIDLRLRSSEDAAGTAAAIGDVCIRGSTNVDATEAAVRGIASHGWTIRRRYTEFHNANARLLELARNGAVELGQLPELPPKENVLRRVFRTDEAKRDFLEERRAALQVYSERLLGTPCLFGLSVVLQLFAVHDVLLSQPEPPASVRIIPLSTHELRTTGRIPSEILSAAGKFAPVMVMVRQAPGRAKHHSVPAAEVLVVFHHLPDDAGPGEQSGGESPARSSFSGEVVGARARIVFGESQSTELGTWVLLEPGRAYDVEACSVAVGGLQSEPIWLRTMGPPQDWTPSAKERPQADPGDSWAAVEAPGADGSSKEPGTPIPALGATGGASPILELGEGAPRRAAAFGAAGEGGDGLEEAEKMFELCEMEEEESEEGEEEEGEEDEEEEEPEAEEAEEHTEGGRRKVLQGGDQAEAKREPRSPARCAKVRRPNYRDRRDYIDGLKRLSAAHKLSFRGQVAKQYAAATTKAAQASLERAPHRLVRDGDGNVSVQVQLKGQSAVAIPGAEEATFERRAAADLDDERERLRCELLVEEEQEVAHWVAAMTSRELPAGTSLRDFLLNGEVLCELANAAALLTPAGRKGDDASVPVPHFHRGAVGKFRQIDNVTHFVRACREFFHLPEHQVFLPIDLAEGKGMQAVARCLYALGGRIQALEPAYEGPRLGVAVAVR